MNIFVVDNDPHQSARDLCDQHIVKMPTENCQMLSAVMEIDGYTGEKYMGHPKSVLKHPCTLWLTKSRQNVMWLLDHHEGQMTEYKKRYGKERESEKLRDAYKYFSQWVNSYDCHLPSLGLTPFVNATPYKDIDDTVTAYRKYYTDDKLKFARWRNSNSPSWVNDYIDEKWRKTGAYTPIGLAG